MYNVHISYFIENNYENGIIEEKGIKIKSLHYYVQLISLHSVTQKLILKVICKHTLSF